MSNSSSVHNITLDQAIQMVGAYRNNKESILHPDHRGKNLLPVSETFDRSIFDELLSQNGCTGIRIYYAMKENDLQVRLVLVGVNGTEDILPSSTSNPTMAMSATATAPATDSGTIGEEGRICPPWCATTSPLNP